MSRIKISYDELEMIAGQIKNLSNDMNTILNDIKIQFDLIGNEAVWSGPIASNVKANFDELSAKFPEFSNSVENCSVFLTTKVIPAYKAADAALAMSNKFFK